MNRRAMVAIAAGLLVAVLIVAGVHEAGAVVRRPEGAAERFLTAASRRSAKDRAKAVDFGDPRLARRLVAFARKDPKRDYFTRIEVGRASGRHGTVRVPYRVRRNDARSSRVVGVAVVVEQAGPKPHGWRVTALEPCCEGVTAPAHGSAPASVGRGVWLLAFGIGLLFLIGSEALLRTLGSPPEPRPSSRR